MRRPGPTSRHLPAALAALVAVLATSLLLGAGGPASASVLGATSVTATPDPTDPPTPGPSPTDSATATPSPTDRATAGPTDSPTASPDPTPPPAPVVTLTSTSRDLTFSWTNDAGAATCALVRDTGASTTYVKDAEECTGGTGRVAVPRTNGTYRVRVTVTVGGLSSSGTSTTSYTLTEPPLTAPAPTATRSGTTLTWTFDAQGETPTCTWSGMPAPSTCASGTTTEVPLVEGAYSLTVGLTNGAGTVSGTGTYTLDLPDPTAPGVTVSAGSDPQDVTWTWDAQGGSSSCTLTGPGLAGTASPCSPGQARRLPAVEGSYRLDVVVTTSGGTSSGYASYVLDLPPPVVPTVSTAVSSTDPQTVTWDWDPDTATSAACTVVGPGLSQALTCPAAGPVTTRLPAVNGDYSLQVALTGPGGTAAAGSSTAYALTLPPPAGPTVTLVSAAGRSVVWSWPDTGTARCTLTGPGVTDPGAVCTSPTSVLLPEREGSYTLSVVVTTPARGPSEAGTSAPYVLDLPAPDVPVVTTTHATPTGDRDVLWTWSQAEGVTAACTLVGPPGSVATTVSCTPGSARTPLPRASGDYRLTVDLTGPGGTSTGTSAAVALDVTAPATPTLTAGQTSPGSRRDPSWTVGLDADATGLCTLTGPGTSFAPTACGPTYTAPLSAAAQGTWTLEAVAVDAYGNTSAPATATHVLDTVPPDAPVLTARQAAAATTTAPAWDLATDPTGSRVECLVTAAADPTVQVLDPACTTPATMPLVGRPDGTYALSVTSIDAAGNRSPVATATYRLDRTGPSLVVTGPAGPGHTPPTWSWSSSEVPAAATCALVRDGVVGAAVACAGGTFSPVLPADGDYTVQVRLEDALGNATTSTYAGTYAYDATAPGLPVVTGPTVRSTQTSVTWTWTGTGTPTCALVRDTVAAPVTCTGNSYDASLPGSGTYALQVTLTDPAGNSSGTASSALYEVDVTAPDAPVVTVPATGTSRAPVFTVTAEAGARLECALDPPGRTALSSPCTAPYTADLRTAVDGAWTLRVRAVDSLGNTGPYAAATYLLDTAPPGAPVVTGPSGLGNDAAPRWSWPVVGGTTAECRLLPGGAFAPCSGGTFSPALPGDGTYTAEVRLTDAAGNTGDAGTSAAYTYDGTRPAPAAVSGPTGTGRIASAVWTFSGEGTARCRLVAAGVAGAWSGCTGAYATTLPSDGTYQLEVELTDAAGNTSTSLSAPYLLDTSAPGAPSVLGPTGPSKQPSVTWTVAGEPGASVECRLVGPDATDWSACGSTVARTLSGDGTHVLQARMVDAAGNTGPAGSSPGYLLDRTAPMAPAVDGPTGPSTSASPSWSFVLPADVTAECATSRDGVVVQDWAACGSTVGRDLSGQADGAYVLSVRLTDLALNTGPAGRSVPYVLDRTAPVAPSVTGPAGPSRDPAPGIAFTGEAGATASCRVLRVGGPAGSFAPCTSPWTAALDTDGTWTAEVRLTDAAGNVGPAGSSAGWVLDTVAPAAPQLSAPTSPGRDAEPTWSVVAEEGATLECRLTAPAGTVPGWTPCAFPYDTTLTAEGTYVLEVRATDAAGGVSPPGRATYVLDTTAPLAPLVVAPPSPSRDRAPSFSFGTSGDDVASCRVTRGSTVVQDWQPCSSPAVVDLADLPDGAYTLAVRVTDLAGNTGPTSTTVHVLDTTPPARPVLTDVPASPNPSHRPRFSFTAEADATTTCRVRRPDSVVVFDGGCTSPFTADLTGLPDGSYRVAVRATDRAGGTSDPAVATYVLDATAPEAAVVTAPASPGTGRTPTWTVVSPTPAECRLTRGTVVLADWRTCDGHYTADLGTAPDGTYVLSVRVPDAAGNVSSVSTSRYVLDTVGAAPATVTAPPSPSSTRTPTWVLASAEDGVTAQCEVLAGTVVRQAYAPCAVSVQGEPFPVDLTGADDGTYVLVVRLTDAAGNAGTEQRSPYVLDTVAPSAVRVAAPGSPAPDTTPTWLIAADAGTTLECRLTTAGPTAGSTAVVQDWAPCTTSYTADLTGRPSASYTLTVRAVDAAGNAGRDVTSVYTLDRTAPPAPGAVVGPTGPSTDRSPRWSFVLEPGSTATCVVARGSTVVRTGPCPNPFTLDLAGAPDGSYTLTVRAVDRAGNPGPARQVSYVLDTTPPAAPTATLVPGSPSSSTAPTWAWTVPDGATSQCRTTAAGAVLLDWAACTSPWTAALAGSPDGVYGVSVRAVDAAGNASGALTGDYRLDRAAGLLAGFEALPPAVGSDRTPTWRLQVEPGEALQCRLSGPDGVPGAWAPCGTARAGGAQGLVDDGSYTADLTGRHDGAYALEVRSVRATGEPGPASRATYVLDTTRPAPAVLASGPDGGTGNDPSLAWAWDADEATPVQCRVLRDGAVLGAGWATCGRSLLLDLEGQPDGTWVLELRTRDAAGNLGDVERGSYRYDTTAPAGVVFTGRPVLAVGGRSLSWTFEQPADAAVLCTVVLAGQPLANQQACTNGFVIPVTGPGTYVLSAEVHDAAGNAGPVRRSSWLVTAAVAPPRVVDERPTPSQPDPRPAADPARPDVVVPTVARQGPVLPGGPGTVVAVGPSLVRTAQRTPVLVPGAGDSGPARAVERAVQAVRRAMPDRIALPSAAQVPQALGRVLGDTFTRAAKQPTVPLAVLAVVVAFLLVQGRIDRRDPKLASAPVEAEPELEFGPVLRAPGLAGGATA
ncbi:MAG: putative internalin [Frankiales bacterium]|nr:putative internalin [Frankiales bacterium]